MPELVISLQSYSQQHVLYYWNIIPKQDVLFDSHID